MSGKRRQNKLDKIAYRIWDDLKLLCIFSCGLELFAFFLWVRYLDWSILALVSTINWALILFRVLGMVEEMEKNETK